MVNEYPSLLQESVRNKKNIARHSVLFSQDNGAELDARPRVSNSCQFNVMLQEQ